MFELTITYRGLLHPCGVILLGDGFLRPGRPGFAHRYQCQSLLRPGDAGIRRLYASYGVARKPQPFMIQEFRKRYGGRRASRLPRSRPGQPDRRTYRLQPGFRAAGGPGSGYLCRYGSVRPTASCGSTRNTSTKWANGTWRSCRARPIRVTGSIIRSAWPSSCCAPVRDRTGQPADSQHRSGRLGTEFVGGAGGFHRARLLNGRPARPARTGSALPARRAGIRRHALRHHGPVRLGLRAGACGDRDRLPQPGAPRPFTCRTASPSCGEHDGEARAGRIGLSRAGRRNAPQRWR